MENVFNLKKAVFLSNEVISSVALPKDCPYEIITSDIRKKLTKLVKNIKDDPFITLIFLNESEYPEFKEIMEKLNNDNLVYNFIIQVNSDDSNNPIFNNFDIGHVWVNNLSLSEFSFTTKNSFHILTERYVDSFNSAQRLAHLIDMKQDQEDLISIGRSLSIEKDPDKLLRIILKTSKKITGADAGSIYLVEEKNKEEKQIRFKYSHTFSKEIPLEEFVIPYDKSSIAGYVAITGKVLNILDVYELSQEDPISFNNSFDLKHSYRTQSMLVVPMRNHIDEIIGVIQLINCKEFLDARFTTGNEAYEIELKTEDDFKTKVTEFNSRYEHLMEAIASQAAISIENNRMIKQIQNQFEEFVKASVTAIESRDPATSGHSFRVAEICTKLAAATNNVKEGNLAEVSFTESQLKELEYAALLHDFGKVYIDLAIFMKSKKLYPKDMDNLLLKMDYLYRWIEIQYLISAMDVSIKDIKLKSVDIHKVETDKEKMLEKIREIKNTLIQLNEPSVIDENPENLIKNINLQIKNIECYDIEGHYLEIINGYERTNLSILRGSLNDEERKEIESHVTHTYNFVKRIPWPPEYKNIPDIAIMHHEKNDGSGYPNHLKEEDIPISAQIMAIADIYDALTATDRPYKKALPHKRAIEIINIEAEKGKLNKDLVDLFVSEKININDLEYVKDAS